ncbi:hypothetical protein [Sporomusa aerivorans]|uniref:hypothetical protein n=1 Tax=Sporomusa aerivorans TaxID=204936 RepID=UPI00352A196B
MHQYAQNLGFASYTDLLEHSKILYSKANINWYVTRLTEGMWAAWNGLDSLNNNYKSFPSYDEAKNYIDQLYYSLYGYPLSMAKLGAKINICCEHCHSNLHLSFIHEDEKVAWLLCPNILNSEEIHDSLAVPVAMIGG